MLNDLPPGDASDAGTGRRSTTSAWGCLVLSARSSLRKSAARLAAALSSSGSAAVVMLSACAAEQVGSQAQRIEGCGAVGSGRSTPGRSTTIRVAMNSTVTSAPIVPNAHASRARTRLRRPVGSKKIGLPVIGECVKHQGRSVLKSPRGAAELALVRRTPQRQDAVGARR